MWYVVRSIPMRQLNVEKMRRELPELVEYRDIERNPMKAFLQALHLIGDQQAVLLEDDVLLTAGFREKIEHAIAERPEMLISFFSLRTTPSMQTFSRFSSSPAIYLPGGFASRIAHHYHTWPDRFRHDARPHQLIHDWLAFHGLPHYIQQPSLVQHISLPSMPGQRRRHGRKSATFVP